MSTFAIKQLAPDRNEELMGLQEIGLGLFPGCTMSFEIPFVNNRPNINWTPEEKVKFEKHFNKNFDTEEGIQWLKEYSINISHDLTTYDTNNVEHQFIMTILKSNDGMGIIAMNDKAIEDSAVNTFKFAVSDESIELSQKVNKREVKMNATVKLDEYWKSNTNRLVTIAKFIFPANAGIGNNKDFAFNKLGDFIDANYNNAATFLSVCEKDFEYVDTVVKIKEGIHRGLISRGQDNMFVLNAANVKLGRTEDEVITYLSDPQNKDLLGYGTDEDLPYSLTTQLKRVNY